MSGNELLATAPSVVAEPRGSATVVAPDDGMELADCGELADLPEPADFAEPADLSGTSTPPCMSLHDVSA
jgi:hypothetical protein